MPFVCVLSQLFHCSFRIAGFWSWPFPPLNWKYAINCVADVRMSGFFRPVFATFPSTLLGCASLLLNDNCHRNGENPFRIDFVALSTIPTEPHLFNSAFEWKYIPMNNQIDFEWIIIQTNKKRSTKNMVIPIVYSIQSFCVYNHTSANAFCANASIRMSLWNWKKNPNHMCGEALRVRLNGTQRSVERVPR